MILSEDHGFISSIEESVLKKIFKLNKCIDGKLFQNSKIDSDMLIIDRELLCCDGIELIEKIKDKGFTNPIVVVSSKTDSSDVVDSFEKGADEYIPKSSNINIIAAKIKAIMNRVSF